MAQLDYLFLGSAGILITALMLIIFRIIKLYLDESVARRRKETLRAMAVDERDIRNNERNERELLVVGGRRVPVARRRVRHIVDEEANRDVGLTSAAYHENEDSEEEYEESSLAQLAKDENIGKKKLAKLQAKEERRKQREAELLEREERKKREKENEERLQKEREEKEREEEEERKRKRLEKEEREKREEEEYRKLREDFVIDQEGFDEVEEDESRNLLKDFEDYIRNTKVVNMDELGAYFNLRTEDAIDRLNYLMKNGNITGVIDDRGKFIYITAEELQAVAKFINQRGRVSRTELVDYSNKLISLESRPVKHSSS
ncbi:unnamed protein product [Thelazia callipaeda]|uniref:DDRGK domain-containing protein 1 n=1 Tax=Thelazia callipaeda TaxID=103827 RepID=A0A0N5CPM1_THECL|nr:unnamed protein product [Thelazia callipaeda]